jgi:uncharacterized protein YndB with AHSA1/START domain
LKTMSVTTHIPSPPDVVWKILTDFPAYTDWNPFITRASGDPRIGHKLSIRIVPPDGRGKAHQNEGHSAPLHCGVRQAAKLQKKDTYAG